MDVGEGILNYLLFAIIITIALTMLIALIVYKFVKQDEENLEKENERENDKDKKNKKKILTIENVLILIGVFVIVLAAYIPFLILGHFNFELKKIGLADFGKLGAVGDYMGGTTVGLLSLASLLFVAAAMMMQKKELELQRKEVMATRKEYEITNRTMKKQSFDSTFFNMINLHRSILSEINYGNENGRKAIEELYETLKKQYIEKTKNKWLHYFWNELDEEGKLTKEVLDSHYIKISNLKSKTPETLHIKSLIEQYIIAYGDLDKAKNVLQALDNLNVINWRNFSFDFEYHEFETRPNYTIKNYYYEEFYKLNESKIGHYFRNLYRIVKYIEEYEFSGKNEINERERKEYRGILRAQLSKYELLMLFYNICYSEKGEKFKYILTGTEFFENHLVQEDFIWINDKDQVKQFKKVN